MPPFELDGRRYVVVTGSAGADEALLHLRDAAQMIERLVAPGHSRAISPRDGVRWGFHPCRERGAALCLCPTRS